MQVIPIPNANGTLKRKQLFRKAPQNFQGSFLVRQENIAPHRRVAGSNSGEIAKPRRRVFYHFAICHAAQIIRHPYHRICNQVRCMAGDSQNKIVVFRIHFLDICAQPFPKVAQPRNRIGVGFRHRHQQAPAVVE